jgi:hypothetical protein
MADIKQAAKWLDEGKDVCRPVWRLGHGVRQDKFGLLVTTHFITPINTTFSTKDLLAEDWEVAD